MIGFRYRLYRFHDGHQPYDVRRTFLAGLPLLFFLFPFLCRKRWW
jgi:hypothetical protein